MAGRPQVRHHSHHGSPTASAQRVCSTAGSGPMALAWGIGGGQGRLAAGLLLSLPCGVGAAAVPGGTTGTEPGLRTEPWSTQKLQLCWKQLTARPREGPGHAAVAGVYTWVPCAPAPVPVPAPHAIGLPAPTAAAATMGSAGRQDRGPLSRHQLPPVPTPASADDHWCLSLPMPIAAGGPAPLPPWHRARCTPCTSPSGAPRAAQPDFPIPTLRHGFPHPCCHPLRGASHCLSAGPSRGCRPAGGQMATLVHCPAPHCCPVGSHLAPIPAGSALTCVSPSSAGCCRGGPRCLRSGSELGSGCSPSASGWPPALHPC